MGDQKAFPGNLVRIKKGKWSGQLAVVSTVDRRYRWEWSYAVARYVQHAYLSYKLAIPKVGYRRFSSGGFDFVAPKEEAR